MGVSLTLLPELYPGRYGGPDPVYPHIVLPLTDRRSLWDKIEDEGIAQPLNQMVWQHNDDEGLEQTANDPYGTPLTFATAQDVSRLLDEWIWTNVERYWQINATAAYVRLLPPLTRVILWWS